LVTDHRDLDRLQRGLRDAGGCDGLGALVVTVLLGTGLYFIARRKETRVPEPEFD
jgi:hypothetical protein